jgi:hypothetical protein
MIARKTQKIIYNIVIICLLIGGVTYVCSRFIHLGNIEYTDNAQVKQHITPINTRVPGFIKKIYFDEYQQVRKGDTLLIIGDGFYYSFECDVRHGVCGYFHFCTFFDIRKLGFAVIGDYPQITAVYDINHSLSRLHQLPFQDFFLFFLLFDMLAAIR